jgi:hypothetical protein
MRRYDMFSRKVIPFTTTDQIMVGTTQVSNRMVGLTRDSRSTVFLAPLRTSTFLEYPVNPTR